MDDNNTNSGGGDSSGDDDILELPNIGVDYPQPQRIPPPRRKGGSSMPPAGAGERRTLSVPITLGAAHGFAARKNENGVHNGTPFSLQEPQWTPGLPSTSTGTADDGGRVGSRFVNGKWQSGPLPGVLQDTDDMTQPWHQQIGAQPAAGPPRQIIPPPLPVSASYESLPFPQLHEDEEDEDNDMGVAETYADYMPRKCDGAGVGKGRTVAGVIFENWLKGRKKHIWVSVSNDLKYDAERDLKDIGAEEIQLEKLIGPKWRIEIEADESRSTEILRRVSNTGSTVSYPIEKLQVPGKRKAGFRSSISDTTSQSGDECTTRASPNISLESVAPLPAQTEPQISRVTERSLSLHSAEVGVFQQSYERQNPENIRNNSFHGDEINHNQNLHQRDNIVEAHHNNYHNANNTSVNQMESYYSGGDGDGQSEDKGYHSNRAAERIQGHNDLLDNSHNHSSITPWSDDDQSSAFMALPMERTDYSDSGHKSRNGDDYRGMENEVVQSYTYENLPVQVQPQQSYVASKYTGDVRGPSEDQFRETDSSYDQLRLLYESRGQQIDKLTDELEKLNGSTGKEIRILRHQKNVLQNEKGGFEASISQLKQLLSDKDGRISTLTTDLKELKLKYSNLEDENKRLLGKLETAESVMSSLEYQVSELQATDSLAKSRKMQEDFLNKVRQNHQEEKQDLITKLKEMQVKLETTQQENQKHQRELKHVKEQNDQILHQKTERFAQLSASLETSQKQCSELLQSNNGQKNLALQVNIQMLEATKVSLENKICTLEEELRKSKDEQTIFDKELKLFLTAPGKILPESDNSIDQLGLKKVLCYDETEKTESEKKKTRLTNEDEGIEELKSDMLWCLEINKKRRTDIEELTKDLHSKQIQLKKLQSDFKSAKIEIQELKELNRISKRQSHEMNHTAMSTRREKQDFEAEYEVIRNENASLKEELVKLKQIVEKVHISAKDMENIIKDLNNNFGSSDSSQVYNFLQITEAFSKSVNGLQIHYDDVNSKLRHQNSLLHKSQDLWGRKIEELIQRVKSSEKSLKYILNGNKGRSIDISFIQNSHQKILEDLYQYSTNLKSAVEPVNKENNVLRDEIWTVRLEMERMKKKEKNMLEEMNSLHIQIDHSKKDREAALESCQNSYLKFHEDSVCDIKAQMVKDHEIIVLELKGQLRKLHNELTNSKTEYLKLCEEKKLIEIEIKQIKSEFNKSKENSNNNKTFPKSFDEQSSTDSLRTETQELAEKWKLFNENYEELKAQKQSVDVECTKLQIELENIKAIKQKEYDLLLKKYKDIKDSECSMCRELKYERDDIAQQLKRSEENIHELEKQKQQILENQNSHNDSTIRIERHQIKNIVSNEKYQHLLKEKTSLQEKYDQEHTEFVQTSYKYKKEILEKEILESLMVEYKDLEKEKEQNITNIMEENSSLKNKVDQIKKERDQDMDELTEKLLSIESDRKEKELQLQSMVREVSKNRSEVSDKQNNHSHELKKLQTQIEQLKVDLNESQITNKQARIKYNNLKVKYKSYGESKDEEVTHYKIEILKVRKEFREGFAINLEKFQLFFEKVKNIVLIELKRLEDELRKNGRNIDTKGVIDMLVQLQNLLNKTEYNPKTKVSQNHQE